MNNSPDERLMQRVIDNECSVEERRELLSQLDENPEGWKMLACGFMEDQLFASAAVAPSQNPLAPVPAPQPAKNKSVSWRTNPLVTRVLAACVMFMLGVVVTRQWSPVTGNPVTANDPPIEVVSNKAPFSGAEGNEDRPMATYASAKPQLFLRAGDQEPQKVDIYDDPIRFISALDRMWEKGQELRSNVTPRTPSRIRYLSHTTEDGELILVPVDEIQFENYIQ